MGNVSSCPAMFNFEITMCGMWSPNKFFIKLVKVVTEQVDINLDQCICCEKFIS